MNNREIKVSVVIPVYNVEKYLQECLNSVMRQSLEQIEIICIEDCSTDHSRDILFENAKKDQRLIVVANNQNQGLSESRNIGLSLARGRYVYFLDSDDYLLVDSLEVMYDCMKENKLDMLSFDSKLIDETGLANNICHTKRQFAYDGVKAGYKLLKMQIDNMDYKCAVWKYIYDLGFIRNNNLVFYKRIYHEDVLFTFEAYLKAKRVLIIPRVFHVYRRRRGSITVDGELGKKMEGFFIVYREAVRFSMSNQNLKNAQVIENCLAKFKQYVIGTYFKCSKLIQDEFKNTLVGYEKILLENILETNNVYIQNDLSPEQYKEIIRYEKIYLFGAGKAAEEWINLLNTYDIAISGIIVSQKNDKKSLYGHKIFQWNEIKANLIDYIIIPSVSKKYLGEIITLLHEANVNILNID